ncbi:hypothetical protein TWF706_004397 [Orbilia oligospora]|nr:hypothetical protein TWF103_003712 [Orbilia oligospora]KAF3104596.1 hypothetical protein TWF706_004397 [Orbilia oligospora]
MHFSLALVSSLLAVGFVCARPQGQVMKSVPATITRENVEARKWGNMRMCLEKKNNSKYFADTCLTSKLSNGLNRLDMLAGLTAGKVASSSKAVWSAFKVTANPLGDYERPGSKEHSFMIVNEGISRNSKPQCLTWEKVPPYEKLEAVEKVLSKTLPTKSYWLGGVTVQDCAFPSNWKSPSITIQLTDTAFRQLFWSKVEGTGKNEKRRIIPRVFAGDSWPGDICNGSLGIFDSLETGKEPDYLKSIMISVTGKTSIGWGCTPQKWSLVAS